MSEKPTIEDVMKWAREAGFQDWAVYGRIERKEDCLNYFAALAYAAGAAAENDRCAEAVKDLWGERPIDYEDVLYAIRARGENNE